MVHTTVFRSNRTQAVRLPKAVAFPDGVTEVEIAAIGDARLITPVSGAIDFWWDHGAQPTIDFLNDRDQPEAQDRGL